MAAADQFKKTSQSSCHAGAIHTRIEVRRIGRQVEEFCADIFDGLRNARHFMGGQIIHDDSLPRLKSGREELFD